MGRRVGTFPDGGRLVMEVTEDKQLHGMKARVMKVLMIATTLINGCFGECVGNMCVFVCERAEFRGKTLRFS